MADNSAAIATFLRDLADQIDGMGATATYHNAIVVLGYNSGSTYGPTVMAAKEVGTVAEAVGLLQFAIMDAAQYSVQGEGRTENIADTLEDP